MSEKNKIRYFKLTTLIALLASILAAPKLWHSDRSMPPVAIHEVLPALPLWLNYIILASILILIVVSLFKEKPAIFLTLILSLSVFLVLFDLNRLLPPFYMFLCCLFVLVLYYYNKISYNTFVTIARIMIIGIYLAAGICKLNEGFDPVNYQVIIAPLKNVVNAGVFEVIKKTSLIIPLTEIFIAFALLKPRLRTVAFVLICITHATILLIMSPIFMGHAFVIYPWNISMVLLSFLFFYKAEEFNISYLKKALKNNYVKLFVVLYILVPFIHLFGYLDTNISYEVHSGKQTAPYLLFSETVYNKLPPDIKAITKPKNTQNKYAIYLYEWFYSDTNSSLYCEERTIKFYKNYIVKITNSRSDEVELFVKKYGVLDRRVE